MPPRKKVEPAERPSADYVDSAQVRFAAKGKPGVIGGKPDTSARAKQLTMGQTPAKENDNG